MVGRLSWLKQPKANVRLGVCHIVLSTVVPVVLHANVFYTITTKKKLISWSTVWTGLTFTESAATCDKKKIYRRFCCLASAAGEGGALGFGCSCQNLRAKNLNTDRYYFSGAVLKLHISLAKSNNNFKKAENVEYRLWYHSQGFQKIYIVILLFVNIAHP